MSEIVGDLNSGGNGGSKSKLSRIGAWEKTINERKPEYLIFENGKFRTSSEKPKAASVTYPHTYTKTSGDDPFLFVIKVFSPQDIKNEDEKEYFEENVDSITKQKIFPDFAERAKIVSKDDKDIAGTARKKLLDFIGKTKKKKEIKTIKPKIEEVVLKEKISPVTYDIPKDYYIQLKAKYSNQKEKIDEFVSQINKKDLKVINKVEEEKMVKQKIEKKPVKQERVKPKEEEKPKEPEPIEEESDDEEVEEEVEEESEGEGWSEKSDEEEESNEED